MKKRTLFTCQQCGCQSPKWLGRCPDCGQWNSLVEESVTPQRGAARGTATASSTPQRLTEVATSKEDRLLCGIGEFDQVLGGGVVAGSLILIGGDPGIGKSTLLLQAISRLSEQGGALYVTAEESTRQVRMRADRLGVRAENLYLLAETSLEAVLEQVRALKPGFLVIDSIQTIFTAALDSAPGSVSQVRECAGRLMQVAKGDAIPTFLVGHVTKDGAIAGPRMLEHMVDTVLYFEGEPGHPYRILRAVKNRFGSTNEIGVFQMKDSGLAEVGNPSELFLSERPEGAAGSAVVPAMEGSRPILVELQALVSGSSFGTPRRTTMGIDHNRVSLLVAVLEKKVGLSLLSQDIFLNVAGGVRLDEPAIDLGVMAALASSHLNRPIAARTIVFGEVGLAGEVRAVSHPELRVKEAARLGFDRCFLPAGSLKSVTAPAGLQLIGVKSAGEVMDGIFD
ncbi:DNA repair protein RadA/Sms [Geoalkalibacter ferrihydriticus]|uniref:DNA repair protein RadA n=2 Tax=Geoalkalibacter ferrihydriticus TaxID=392333 RepID=A0A0C2HKE6_9BACT|nr:DNA repair protein RadA [Geoalkalibacter ferrihydriticus]KIH77541.1 DNA repair protein RadA [Geoalkalibacter ferrihydriticus DSM 17813]SDL67071.1 DNA repair protein RadA/Sms [Geoalkalibacter ferrihydriticus]